MSASAPGKVMIAGEYAVLHGLPAVVGAVSARATARWSARRGDGSDLAKGGSPETPALPLEARHARRYAEIRCNEVPWDLMVDTSPLRTPHAKLGLGSSAAAAAASAGAVFAAAGRDLQAPEVREEIFEAALAGHHAVASRGSGADVAASVFGGVLHFERDTRGVTARPLRWPNFVWTRLVWTGAEARTSRFIDEVFRYAEDSPADYRRRIAAIGASTERFLGALETECPDQLLGAVREHAHAMSDLGEAAGVGIVEERLSRVEALATQLDGASKPSGAGGGDVAIAFFIDRSSAEAFDAMCAAEGFLPLELALGEPGVRTETSEVLP